MNRSDFFSPGQLAEYLSVSKQTLYRWRSEKQGPRWVKVGGRIRYRKEDVDRYLSEQTSA